MIHGSKRTAANAMEDHRIAVNRPDVCQWRAYLVRRIYHPALYALFESLPSSLFHAESWLIAHDRGFQAWFKPHEAAFILCLYFYTFVSCDNPNRFLLSRPDFPPSFIDRLVL